MSQQDSNLPASSDFFRNYRRIVGAAYLSILVLTFCFFLYQLHQNRQDEIETIQGHFSRHAQFIEFTLRARSDMLDALRISATDYYASVADPAQLIRLQPLLAKLQQRQHGFDLDAAPERDGTGNLVGLGSLTGRSERFYRDEGMALSLNPILQAVAFTLPNVAETRFVSLEMFSHAYPWAEASKRPFNTELYETPTWLMGTPQQNPERQKYWAPVFFGGVETGLLAPIAAPIYDSHKGLAEEHFRGIVSIDTSLDYLNRINSDFGYRRGTIFLVDAYDQVLAHPELFADPLTVKSTRTAGDILPAGILQGGKKLQSIPAGIPQDIAGHLIIRHSFIAAPWHMVYVVPQRTLWMALLADRAPLMLLIFVGLTLLMVVTYRVTSREFISPSAKLVAHISAESQFNPAPIPAVPDAWRPWFETISKAFQESLQLANIRQELDIASSMQHSILPRTWPQQEGFEIWGTMRSAKEVGGDFYDHFSLEGRIGIVVADVSDKGVPAALFGMVSKTLIRATALRGGSPSEMIEATNNTLCEDNDTCMFVTTLFALFDPRDGNFTYVSAGHPPPLLLHADGTSEFLPTTRGPALGVVDGTSYQQASVTLQPGDYVIAYTDGVSEAFNEQGEEFTLARLPSIFAGHRPESVKMAVERIIQAVDAHAGSTPQSDDITCVALHYRHAASTSTTRDAT
jgi:sigma-B regulation protein RsbU (phosphoserine phosphatase)